MGRSGHRGASLACTESHARSARSPNASSAAPTQLRSEADELHAASETQPLGLGRRRPDARPRPRPPRRARAVAREYDEAAEKVREHAAEVQRLLDLIATIERQVRAIIGEAIGRVKDAVSSVVDGIKDALTPGDEEDRRLAETPTPPPGHKDWLDDARRGPGGAAVSPVRAGHRRAATRAPSGSRAGCRCGSPSWSLAARLAGDVPLPVRTDGAPGDRDRLSDRLAGTPARRPTSSSRASWPAPTTTVPTAARPPWRPAGCSTRPVRSTRPSASRSRPSPAAPLSVVLDVCRPAPGR